MKLNPRASSSDVDIAREIARRLHHHRRREDRPATTAAPVPHPAPPAPTPATPAVAVSQSHVEPTVEAAPPAAAEAAPPRVEPTPVELPPLEPPAVEPPLAIPAMERQHEPAPAYGEQEGSPSEAVFEAPPAPTPPPPAPAPPAQAQAAFERAAPPAPAAAEQPLPGLEDPGPPTWDEEPPPPPPPGAASDVDDVLDALASVPPPDVDAVPAPARGGVDVSVEVEDDEPGAAAAPPPGAPETPPEEELFDTPSPPSWEQVAENCMRVAGAHGAMLVDPRGQVFAARGDWPDPGPDAIAGRLVAMMDRALRDAPTRSVSAPVAGMHLTAWRIPTPGGLITTALVADEPVRAELRHVVDTEIHRAAGS